MSKSPERHVRADIFTDRNQSNAQDTNGCKANISINTVWDNKPVHGTYRLRIYIYRLTATSWVLIRPPFLENIETWGPIHKIIF